MTQADTLYEAFKAQVSLRGFARIMGQPYWRLRHDRRLSARRSEAADQYDHLVQQVRLAALEAPTYGYRRLGYVLRDQGVGVGRDRLRRLLRTLG